MVSMDAEWSQLRQRLALTGQRPIHLFFRDDDAAGDLPSLRRLLDLFYSRQTPINLQIIPGLLTDDGAELLRRTAALYPGLIGLNQHGWRHDNHELTGKRSEFGPTRSFDQQLLDIRTGRQRLEEVFGSSFFPVFTPPWNRYTPTTSRALATLGYVGVSDFGSASPMAVGGVTRLPATIDIIDWRGTRDLRPTSELLSLLSNQLTSVDTIGILLHHQVMSAAAFDFTACLLDTLIESGAICFHLFQSLLSCDRVQS